MDLDVPNNAADDPGFFNGRLTIEIERWNWALYVGLSHPITPATYRYLGGLNYSRGIEIPGRIRAPLERRGIAKDVWISPAGPAISFGADGLDRVGQFCWARPDNPRRRPEASLILPADALASTITCLNSVWKFVDIWLGEEEGGEADVTAFAFSDTTHPNLVEWTGAEFER